MNKKIAIITGPSSEIGISIIKKLIKKNFHVLLLDKNKVQIKNFLPELKNYYLLEQQ